ncbi:MAG: Eco57I restriction-modification methylase domain-containing protein, partial [Leptospiraceae bacterium]|nr:Eco57I restriction-modification methylase domain-containing protein [Leptospiraceae bacterium]
FDWEKEFPEGKFDVIIGNPPYVKIQTLTESQADVVPYLKRKYFSAQSGNIDIYVVFLEKILSLVKPNGLTGYILPHKFFQADMGANIRRLIAEKKAVVKILNFGHIQIFKNATTYTCLFFMSGSPNEAFRYAKVEGEKLQIPLSEIQYDEISSEKLFLEKWNFHTDKRADLLEKLSQMPLKLKAITRKIFQGLATSADKIYVLKKTKNTIETAEVLTLYSQSLEREIQIEKGLLKPFLLGKDVKRYEPPIYLAYVIFPYRIENDKAELMERDFIQTHFPLGWQYLLESQKQLKNQERGRFKESWWQFSRPQNLTEFETIKIMSPDISDKCNFTLDEVGNLYHTTTIYSISFNEKANLNPLVY